MLQSTAGMHYISTQVLSSQSIVSSSRSARLCSPWGGRRIGHWRTTWSTVCSSAPHSQAVREAMVSAAWSRCPGSMALRVRHNVSRLRRSSAGWTPARIGRLSAGVGRKHSSQFARRCWWQDRPFLSRVRHFFAKVCNAITRQPIELESCSNHLRIQQVF